jgi:hypothetical protein
MQWPVLHLMTSMLSLHSSDDPNFESANAKRDSNQQAPVAASLLSFASSSESLLLNELKPMRWRWLRRGVRRWHVWLLVWMRRMLMLLLYELEAMWRVWLLQG